MQAICVFCGSSAGLGEGYVARAQEVGRRIAEQGLALVYGGGSVGLMGVVANAALEAGGEVIGIIPRKLWDMEVGHRSLTSLHIVETMHDRKAMMADLSDAFLVLPGGIGTMEEFFEVWTWGQLGLHGKPVGLLNCQGYYDGLFTFLDTMVTQGFLNPKQRAMVLTGNQPEAVLKALMGFETSAVRPLVALSET